jgi:hypothetical protein
MPPALHSNIQTFLEIAENANAEAQRLLQSKRSPKPDGSAGYVVLFDPARQSFKQSLIAIAFAGIYFEALAFIVGTSTFGSKWERDLDKKWYETKLLELGISDEGLIQSAKRLRLSRNDLLHEKAHPLEKISITEIRRAQTESAHAIDFIVRLNSVLRPST